MMAGGRIAVPLWIAGNKWNPEGVAGVMNREAARRDQRAGRIGEGTMADRRSLGILGFLFGGITAAVMLVAVVVVKHHIDGRALESGRLPVVAALQPVNR